MLTLSHSLVSIGRLWAGVEFDVKPNSRISPATKQVQLRVKEEKDKELGADQHPDTENHVDPMLPLSPTGSSDYKWQKRLNSAGQWQDTSEAFTTPNLSQSDTVNYRVLWPWNTSKPIQLDTKLWDHNGEHTVALVSATAGQKQVRFEAADDPADSIVVKDFYQRKVPVKNLVIENVSTSNGTSDYFKFDSASDNAGLREPKIYFSIDDKGDSHVYRWRVRVRGTNIEDTQDSLAYEGIATASKQIEVKVNQSPIAADFPADALIREAGAYNFEISVREYATEIEANAAIEATRIAGTLQEGDSLDTANLRSVRLFLPHNMPIPNKNKAGHGGWVDFADELRPVWHLSHYLKHQGVVGTLAKDVRVDLLPPDLSDPLAEVSIVSNYNTPYLDRVFYTFKPGEWRNNKVWIAVTTAKDVNGTPYRDHKNRSMLAKNDRAEHVSEPEVVSVTPADASKILISATLGDYPTDAQGELANAPAKNEDAFAKVKITAIVVNAESKDEVFFEVTDPDDASSYIEAKPEKLHNGGITPTNGGIELESSLDNGLSDNGNDNREPAKNGRMSYGAFQTACLSRRSVIIGEGNSEQIDATTWKVWVILNITTRCSGDNYIVNATATKPPRDDYFRNQEELTDKYKSSGLLVAWKRIYCEFARMFQSGATTTESFNPSTQNIIKVDNVGDFTVGDTVILWNKYNPEAEMKVEEVNSESNSLALSGYVGPSLSYFDYSGVRIKGKDELMDDIPRENLPSTYGGAIDGSDGGPFVDVREIQSWQVPKMTIFPGEARPMQKFVSRWRKNSPKENVLAIIFTGPIRGYGGLASADGTRTAVVSLSATPIYRKQALSHEIGHLLKLFGDFVVNEGGHHVDDRVDALDHEGNKMCVMSYNGGLGRFEFDHDCLYRIRDSNKPF